MYCFNCKKLLRITENEKYEIITLDNGKIYCEDCFYSKFLPCVDCFKHFPIKEICWLEDEPVCTDCYIKAYPSQY